MNPRQLRVMLQPESGRWFLVRAMQRAASILRDVTQDIALCLLGDIRSSGDDATGIEYEIEATAPNGDYVRLRIRAEILQLTEKGEGQ